MKSKFRNTIMAALGGLVALAILFVIALAVIPQPSAKDWLLLAFGAIPVFGVTVTYEFFQAGILVSGTTPPTIAQALNENMLNATLNWADGDTTATLTHNWNLSAAELSALLPIVSVMPTQANTNTCVVALTAQATGSVTLGKNTGVGTGGTYNVWMLRPNTLIR